MLGGAAGGAGVSNELGFMTVQTPCSQIAPLGQSTSAPHLVASTWASASRGANRSKADMALVESTAVPEVLVGRASDHYRMAFEYMVFMNVASRILG